MRVSPADLPLNADGSVYHLNLLPGEIADTIILVGDPDRATQISTYFDSIEVKKQKREFLTYTGFIGKKRLSVVGTGISVGNIDIVINEIDALVNIDLTDRTIKSELKSLDFIRLGTAGGIQAETEIGSFVLSNMALGFDNLLDFYRYPFSKQEKALNALASHHFDSFKTASSIYATEGNPSLIHLFSDFTSSGITLTAPGFYGPQYRRVRAALPKKDLLSYINAFRFGEQKILNFEMETAAIYGLGKLLGHRCCSISAIIANRAYTEFCKNPAEVVKKLIENALRKIAN